MTHAKLGSIARWQLSKPSVKRVSFPIDSVDLDFLRENKTESTVTWIGHATFLLQHAGKNILTDPHFSDRASPFSFVSPKRTTPPAISIADLPKIDYVVISHDHYDHLDQTSVIALCQKQKDQCPLFFVPLKLGRWLSKRGINNWVELDWWQSHLVDGWKFTAVPTQHFSGRGLKQNNTLWAGWVLENAQNSINKRFFFAGDTGYSNDFKKIGEVFESIDVAMIPIGAYAPRWFMKEVHVTPEEAVRIHCDVESKLSVAMHWGAFVLTDEPMDQPPIELRRSLDKNGINPKAFIVPNHGKILRLNEC